MSLKNSRTFTTSIILKGTRWVESDQLLKNKEAIEDRLYLQEKNLFGFRLHALAADMGASLKNRQEKIEQAYLEDDILFNDQLLETEQQKQTLDKKP